MSRSVSRACSSGNTFRTALLDRDGESYLKGSVEDGLAGRVLKLGNDDGVSLRLECRRAGRPI